MLQSYDRAYKTFQEYKRIRNKPKAKQYRKKHFEDIKKGKRLSKLTRKIGAINTKITLIRESTKYTPEQKRDEIDMLLQKRETIFNNALKRMK